MLEINAVMFILACFETLDKGIEMFQIFSDPFLSSSPPSSFRLTFRAAFDMQLMIVGITWVASFTFGFYWRLELAFKSMESWDAYASHAQTYRSRNFRSFTVFFSLFTNRSELREFSHMDKRVRALIKAQSGDGAISRRQSKVDESLYDWAVKGDKLRGPETKSLHDIINTRCSFNHHINFSFTVEGIFK